MAWPNTPFESDVANVTVVHAALATALQAAIIGLTQGSMSIAAVVVDGTGGTNYATPVPSGTPPAGAIRLTGVGSAGAFPSTTVPLGTFYREAICLGWCTEEYDNAGGLHAKRYYNVFSSTRNSPGDYTVIFNATPSDAATANVQITASLSGGTECFPVIFSQDTDGAGRMRVRFQLYDNTNTARDNGWRIEVKAN